MFRPSRRSETWPRVELRTIISTAAHFRFMRISTSCTYGVYLIITFYVLLLFMCGSTAPRG